MIEPMHPPRIIQRPRPTAGHRQALLDRLVAFSDPRAGAGPWPARDLGLVIRGPDGAPAGGLWGRFFYDWLFIELVFVPEERRAEGLGAALLAMAEDQARAWGATGVWLDTFSFQARGFYEKKDYAVFGEIADFPPPHKRFFLKKCLAPPAPPPAAHRAITGAVLPQPALRGAIGGPLSRFNDSRVQGGPWSDEALSLLVEGPDDAANAGLWGRSYYGWLHVDALFVPESLRGRGIGTALLEAAEAAARARGCRGVWLDTFSFQAPDFYPRHGYRPFGRIDNYPAPHRRLFLGKRL